MNKDIMDDAQEGKILYNSLFDEKYEIGVRLQDRGVEFPTHYHNYIEIVCQLDGDSIHFVDDKKYILKQGEFIIIDPSKSHRNIASDNTTLNIIISTRFLNNLVIESAFDETIINIKNSIINGYHKDKYEMDDYSKNILIGVYNLYIDQDQTSMYYIRQKLMLINFLMSLENLPTLLASKTKTKSSDLITYIQSNITTATLGEYAKSCNYSSSLISQKIKAEYNMTFIEILQEMRLKLAANMLISTNKSIDTIMHEVGYNNKTHFYDLFKTKYQMTPSKYQKSHR